MHTEHDCCCLTATGNCTAHAYTDRKGRIVGMKRCTRTAQNARACIDYYTIPTESQQNVKVC